MFLRQLNGGLWAINPICQIRLELGCNLEKALVEASSAHRYMVASTASEAIAVLVCPLIRCKFNALKYGSHLFAAKRVLVDVLKGCAL